MISHTMHSVKGMYLYYIAYYETPVLCVILYDLLIGVHDMRQDIESIVH